MDNSTYPLHVQRNMTNSHSIMTLNMNGRPNGHGTPAKRRMVLKKIIDSSSQSIIFCQEIFGKKVFPKFVEDLQPESGRYTFENTGKETAVIWDEGKFICEELNTTERMLIQLRDSLTNLGEPASELLTRSTILKLSPTNNPKFKFIVVSWHGPQRLNSNAKIQIFKALLKFLKMLSENEGNIPFLIGGDFNLDTCEIDLGNDDIFRNIVIREYDLEAELKPKQIPYKDNFVVFSVREPLNRVPLPLWNITEDIRHKNSALFDHNPVLASLTFAETSLNMMTLNMNRRFSGQGAEDQCTVLKSIIGLPSIIFCQKFGADFEEVVNKIFPNCSKEIDQHTAIIWDKNIFTCSEKIDRRDAIPKNHGLTILKLTKLLKNKSEFHFLVVSWYGPETDVEVKTKIDIFEILLDFVKWLSKEQGNIPFLIGGDFNLDTSSYFLRNGGDDSGSDDDGSGSDDGAGVGVGNVLKNINIYTYEREANQTPNQIPFKDNFIFFKVAERPNIRQVVERVGQNLLDHNPVSAILTYAEMTIMSLNMNGPYTFRRTELDLKLLIDSDSPSVIFCQKPLADFEQFVGNLQFPNYCCGGADEKTAVIWDKNSFTRGEVDDSAMEVCNTMLWKGAPGADVLLSRSTIIKLSPTNNPEFHFIVVSWYGPNTDVDESTRIDIFKTLLRFVKMLSERENNIPFLIGGDFNLNTWEVKRGNDIFKNIVIPSFFRANLMPNQIRHKDNFIFFNGEGPPNPGSLALSNIRQEVDRVDQNFLDHNPVLANLNCGGVRDSWWWCC